MAAKFYRFGRRVLQTSVLVARYYFFIPVPVLEREVLALAQRGGTQV